ncbi:hypothetical protein [Polymorphospora sp. NPDC050346]|uniref:MmyB family transcriptional regulator n=1 Tax=Polymorphospora sp. NPDC050346 TaxID=3155780 RepID=UPI00340BABA9
MRALQAVEAGRVAWPVTMAAIGTALDLDTAGRRHLARLTDPPRQAPVPADPDHLARMVAAIAVPAWVVDPAWNVLATSAASRRGPRPGTNLVVWATSARRAWDDWPHVASQLMARSRAVSSWYAEPVPGLSTVVADLARASRDAAEAWSAGRVADTPHQEVVGYRRRQLTLLWAQFGDDPATRLVMVTD